MKKTRRLIDKSSVSFQMFLILLSLIAVGLESQISVDQVTLYSSNVKDKGILRYLLCFVVFWGWSMHRSHMALRSVQFIVSFISFYFEILSYLACGEKIIRLASKIA